MTLFHAVILGIVEGITEFLPISSTAHLIITSELLHIPPSSFLATFEIVIQGAAVLAVLFMYGKLFIAYRSLVGKVLVAFLPTMIAGLFLYGIIKRIFFESDLLIALALFFGGVLIIFFERSRKRDVPMTVLEIAPTLSYRDAFIIGVAQILAFIPGVSRSATTILAGRSLRLSSHTIVIFSFLLSLPTIGGATLYELYKTDAVLSGGEWKLLIAGGLVSFVVATLSIRTLLRYVSSHSFSVFGWYRVFLGGVLLLAVFL